MEQTMGAASIERILAGESATGGAPQTRVREVYRKGDAVRKILVIERNHPEFHRFTIRWTDYSEKRAEPFKNETVCADSEERMEALVAGYREEAGKRGWAKAA